MVGSFETFKELFAIYGDISLKELKQDVSWVVNSGDFHNYKEKSKKLKNIEDYEKVKSQFGYTL